MIREINFTELEDLLPMASEFHARVGHGTFSATSFLRTWEALMEAKVGRIAVRFVEHRPVEAIGYLLTADMLTGDRVGHALFWMFPESRSLSSGSLYRHVIASCKSSSALRLSFQVPESSPRREEFMALLDRSGYTHTETLHTVDLWPKH